MKRISIFFCRSFSMMGDDIPKAYGLGGGVQGLLRRNPKSCLPAVGPHHGGSEEKFAGIAGAVLGLGVFRR